MNLDVKAFLVGRYSFGRSYLSAENYVRFCWCPKHCLSGLTSGSSPLPGKSPDDEEHGSACCQQRYESDDGTYWP